MKRVKTDQYDSPWKEATENRVDKLIQVHGKSGSKTKIRFSLAQWDKTWYTFAKNQEVSCDNSNQYLK